jgi:hypothetical protein
VSRRVLHGKFEDVAARLTELNRRGAGIFLMVNEGDGTTHRGAKSCRTDSNVTRVRAHCVDLDNAPVDLRPVRSALVPPGIIVESSPGKYQVCWLTEGCPLDQSSVFQRVLLMQRGTARTGPTESDGTGILSLFLLLTFTWVDGPERKRKW